MSLTSPIPFHSIKASHCHILGTKVPISCTTSSGPREGMCSKKKATNTEPKQKDLAQLPSFSYIHTIIKLSQETEDP